MTAIEFIQSTDLRTIRRRELEALRAGSLELAERFASVAERCERVTRLIEERRGA